MVAPRFTVWISTRNATPWIARSIASLRAQGFRDWEAIFIDDSSSDGATWQAAEAAIDHDKRFQSIRNSERIRQVGCYLAALPLMRGEIVLELDGDDWLLEDALFHVSALYDKGADATCGQNNSSGGIPEIPRERFWDRLSHSYAPRTWTLVLAREALARFGDMYLDEDGKPWQSAGDIAMWAPICALAPRILGTAQPVYYVNMDNEQSDWRLEGGLQIACRDAIRARWEERLSHGR